MEGTQMSRELIRHTYYTTINGDITELTNEERHQKRNEDFTLSYNRPGLQLLKLGLTLVETNVFHYMCHSMGYENYIYVKVKIIADYLGYNEQVVRRAMSELIKYGLIARNPDKLQNNYMVNPYYEYRGENRKRAMAKFNKWVQAQTEKQSSAEPTSIKHKSIVNNNKKHLKTALQKSAEHGNSAKQKLLDYLNTNRDEQNEIHKTIDGIVAETDISRMTVIKFLQYLVELGFICKPKNGVIQIVYDWD